MDIQFHGVNCLTFSVKGTRLIIDDNLEDFGAKSLTKADDVSLFTGSRKNNPAKLVFDGPGEYEVADISITGIPARANMDDKDKPSVTMFKLVVGDQNILITGHIYPELSEAQLERIGIIDLMFVPVGGNGYTTDPVGALKLIKAIEPKLVVPTTYADKALNFPVILQELENAIKEIGMEPRERVTKLKLKAAEMSDVTQLLILEKS